MLPCIFEFLLTQMGHIHLEMNSQRQYFGKIEDPLKKK